jgi:heptosyltransferase-1
MRFPVRIGRKERGILPLQGDFPSVPRILFVKTSSLGDVIHHCPAVSDAARAFRRRDRLDRSRSRSLQSPHCNAHVRRVIPVAVRRWRGALWDPSVWSEIGSLRRSLAAQAYDFVASTRKGS